MNIRSLLTVSVALLLPFPGGLRAQQAAAEDRELAILETRLQEQRAAAIRARLILYTDELQALQTQFANAGDSASADAVQRELETARLAVKRLTAIARGRADPAVADELKDGEPLNATALAAKRIDGIIARFDPDLSNAPAAPGRILSASPPRQRVLRMERATRNPEYAEYDGASYWAYESSYAAWTVEDMAPGEYEVILRYSAGENTGGKAVVKIAGRKLEVTVPKREKGQGPKEQKLNAGTVKVKEPGVDIRVEHGGLARGADYLWNLEAVLLQPAGKRP